MNNSTSARPTINRSMEILTRKEALERGSKTYYNGNKCKYGHKGVRSVSGGDCIECRKERRRSSQWKARQDEYSKKWRSEHYEQSMLVSARARAKRKNIPFNITVEDIVIPEVCPILNLPLEIAVGGKKDNSPSLDRIDNNKGYVKGNVVVISDKANRLKGNLTLKEIFAFAEFYKQYEY